MGTDAIIRAASKVGLNASRGLSDPWRGDEWGSSLRLALRYTGRQPIHLSTAGRTYWGERLRTILVVEDDRAIGAIIQGVLTSHGFRVLTTESGAEAFAVMQSEAVHLIICDVHMPGLSGPELLSELRARRVFSPVLFISGQLELATVDASLRVPGASFLPKPFSHSELLDAVLAKVRET